MEPGDNLHIRVLLAKVGLDGHDRGLRIVSRILRDAGCEVIYAGLRQSPQTITAAVIQEDVDVVGLSMHNGAHLTLAPSVVSSLREAGLDTPVIIGGIVPQIDITLLRAEGIAHVLGPGSSNQEVINAIRSVVSVPFSDRDARGARPERVTLGERAATYEHTDRPEEASIPPWPMDRRLLSWRFLGSSLANVGQESAP